MSGSKPIHVKETKSKVWKDAIRPLGVIHPIFPFGKVYKFRENIYSIYEYTFDGGGDPWMHLIDGPEKALLIDTGFGIGNLRGLVEELVGDKEVIVVNTHPHIDHCWGNFQWDRAYCHEYAVPAEKSQHAKMWDILYDFEEGHGFIQDFKLSDIAPWKDYEIIGCRNHTIFNLGGDYEVEMIFLPGHDPGHCVFLDKHNRILFGGDSLLYVCTCGSDAPAKKDGRRMYHGEQKTVECYHRELEGIAKRLNEFDCVFMSHMVLGEDKQFVADMFEAADRIMNDPDSNNFIQPTRSGFVNKVMMVNLASIAYSDGWVYEEPIRKIVEENEKNGNLLTDYVSSYGKPRDQWPSKPTRKMTQFG
ncbi:MAG: MBL fold metallo-hydrolase [Oscillospiraceae bacterium]